MQFGFSGTAYRVHISVLLLATTLITGCADLRAIGTWAETSSDVAAYSAILDDYESSPDRQMRYTPKSQHAALEGLREQRSAQVVRLKALHTAVREYMQAIGALAGGNVVVYDAEFDALASEVKSNPQLRLSDSQVSAYSGLTNLVLRAATDDWRQTRLATLVDEANPHFQVVIDAMESALEKEVADAVEDEELAVDQHFGRSVRRLKAAAAQANISANALASLHDRPEMGPEIHKTLSESLVRSAAGFEGVETLVGHMRDDQMAVFAARKQAIEEYRKILTRIAEGHQALADGKADLSSKALASSMLKRAKALKRSFAKVQAVD